MIKSAVSHGGVVIFSIFFGPILTEFIKPGLPGLYEFFVNIGAGISNLINNLFGVHADPAAFYHIIIALLIGLLWGIFYGLIRHRTNPTYGQR